MAKITDPDSLAQTTDVVFDTGAKTIQILTSGAVSNSSPGSTSGVTLQCIYSFTKEEWKTDTTLNKFKFPIKMYTKTDGTFINGWTFADATSRNVIRDGGWTEGSNQYAGIVSLGSFAASTEQAYFQQTQGYNQGVTNFNKTGNLNESILITGYTGFLKNFLRIQARLYAEYDLLTEQSIAALEPVLYKLPLANSTDLNISISDLTIDTTTPYVGTSELNNTDGSVTAASPTLTSATGGFVSGDVNKLITIASGSNAGQYKIVTFTDGNNVNVDRNFEATESSINFHKRPRGIKINYLKGTGFTTAAATTYAIGDVVQDGVGRWAFCTGAGTVETPGGAWASFGGTSTWEAYDGEVQMGAVYYAFNRIISANNATATQIYHWMQRQLRTTGVGKAGGVLDINANDSTTTGQRLGIAMRGNIAELLGEYVGATLKTKGGLGIVSFNTNSTNSLKFRDVTVDGGGVSTTTYLPVTTTERAFPFIAAGTLQFSQNLVDDVDGDTLYTMYFLNAGGNQFDSTNAIIVKKNPYPSGADITGQITASSVDWDFDYTNNAQGGRTPNEDAAVVVVAQGLNGATWTSSPYTITAATGQNITVTADDERNYSNP